MEPSSPRDAPLSIQEQIEHQVRLTKQYMTWWMPLIFLVGFVFAALALYTTLQLSRGALPWGLLLFLGFFTLFFGWAVIQYLTWPLFVKPRVVPCFARELEPYGGSTTPAFWKGRALFLALPDLDRRAVELGLKPLSSFGFTDDYYRQEIVWRPAREGLETALALRASIPESTLAADLDALIVSLRVAQDKQVPFCLVLRLSTSDSLQGVCTREARSGRFW